MMGLDISSRIMMGKKMAQDHVNVGTVRNLNREYDIGMPKRLPSTSSWIVANLGDERAGCMARDDGTEDGANSRGHNE